MASTRRDEVSRPKVSASDAHPVHLSDRTPPARTDPVDSTFSAASAVVIAELREQLRDEIERSQEKDALLAEMRAAILAAGLIGLPPVNSDVIDKKGGEKRKGEGSAGPSKKGNFVAKRGERGGKTDFCRVCNSTHHGPCGKDTLRCKRCGRCGHVHQDCRSNDKVCYNCREMGHISTQCTKPKGWNNMDPGKRVEILRPIAGAYHVKAEEE